jgi:hypothetical protein
MFFALLEMIQSQRHGFMPPQAAREQQCEQCSVAFSFQSLMIGCLPKCLALLRGQPIAEAHSQRFLRECGFRFMTDGLHATDQ